MCFLFHVPALPRMCNFLNLKVDLVYHFLLSDVQALMMSSTTFLLGLLLSALCPTCAL